MPGSNRQIDIQVLGEIRKGSPGWRNAHKVVDEQKPIRITERLEEGSGD